MEHNIKSKETGFFQRNLNLKLFSLFIAIVLWMYVHSTDFSFGVVYMKADLKVPIMYERLAKNLFITESPSYAIVTVQGAKEQVESLLPSHLKVSVSQLISYPGTYNMNLEVDKPQGVTILKISPENISFSVARRTEKEVLRGTIIRN